MEVFLLLASGAGRFFLHAVLVGDSSCLLTPTSALPPPFPPSLWDLSLTPAFVGPWNPAALGCSSRWGPPCSVSCRHAAGTPKHKKNGHRDEGVFTFSTVFTVCSLSGFILKVVQALTSSLPLMETKQAL